jgi:hypothetical protein
MRGAVGPNWVRKIFQIIRSLTQFSFISIWLTGPLIVDLKRSEKFPRERKEKLINQ